MKNLVLIGMPGAGKSTIGVILAKVMGFQFIDTDLIIQERENRLLKDIIKEEGLDRFIEIEDNINQSINATKSVISPGGSVVYGQKAMKHFQEIGIVIYIKLSFKTVKKRLGNIKERGVVLKEGQDLKDIYDERCLLYEKYAHITVDAERMDIESAMECIKIEVEKFTKGNS